MGQLRLFALFLTEFCWQGNNGAPYQCEYASSAVLSAIMAMLILSLILALKLTEEAQYTQDEVCYQENKLQWKAS